MGGARVTALVTLRKCTLGNKREIKTLKFVSASTKGFKGGLAWIKPTKKDMAVTFSYSLPQGPGPPAPQGVRGELPPPSGGAVDAAGRMGNHAGRCAPPPGSPTPQPPRAPGPPVCPEAPAKDPPGDTARRHPPVGHHPEPSPGHTHPLTTPQASAHQHRRHPQHPRSPARHTTRRT